MEELGKMGIQAATPGETMSSQKEKGLLDDVRNIMRLKHYSIHTERSYCDWIRRYV